MTAPARPLPSDAGRVLDVLALLAEGRTLQRIARDWGVEPGTVRIYAARLRRYLGAETNAQAVYLACLAGLLDGRPLTRHGDHAGYEAHRKRRIPYCDACIEGEKAYRAELKAAKTRERASEAPGEPRPSRSAPAPSEAATAVARRPGRTQP